MVSSDFVFLGSMLSQARHFLCSKQDIPCVPSRTRLKSHEDGSDFDDFVTKTIAAAQIFFSKIFAPPTLRRRGAGACAGSAVGRGAGVAAGMPAVGPLTRAVYN